MGNGHIADLPRRAVVAVGGADAQSFLDGLITNDLAEIGFDGAGYGALLTPQGKILFDFIVFRNNERFVFDLPKSMVPDFIKRLGFYKLRAKVDIIDLSKTHSVAAAWGCEQPDATDRLVAADPRLKALGFRLIVRAGAPLVAEGTVPANEADYDAHRIRLGVPEGGVDFAYGETFPHDADMDQLGGVDFGKGCYVGQEVVSRMEHRGTARRRIVHVRSASPIPPAGAEISADDKPVGVIASSAGRAGLARVRLDRTKLAIDSGVPLLVRGMPIDIAIPDWATFGWPNAEAKD